MRPRSKTQERRQRVEIADFRGEGTREVLAWRARAVRPNRLETEMRGAGGIPSVRRDEADPVPRRFEMTCHELIDGAVRFVDRGALHRERGLEQIRDARALHR